MLKQTYLQAVALILSFTSLFIPWTIQPTYNIFTIADYATTFSRHFDSVRILSILTVVYVVLICVCAISVLFTKINLFVSAGTYVYNLGYCVYTATVIYKLNLNSSLIPRAPGAYISSAGAIIGLGYVYFQFREKGR